MLHSSARTEVTWSRGVNKQEKETGLKECESLHLSNRKYDNAYVTHHWNISQQNGALHNKSLRRLSFLDFTQ